MARPGKYFRFIKNEDRRERLWRAYVHYKQIYNKGESEIGWFRSMASFQSYMVAWLFLRDLHPDLPYWMVFAAAPVLVAFKIALYFAVGLFWDRERIFDYEHDWKNKRDPMMKAISRKTLSGEGIQGR